MSSKFFQDWKSYRQEVIPFVAQEHTQHIETKRAFYAGGWAMLMLFKNMPAFENDDDGVAYLDRLQAELKQFQNDVLNGKQ